MTNYWRMSDFSLFSVTYAYVDNSSYLADQLFAQNKVRMRFKGDMMRDGSSYRIIFCKVHKSDISKFEEAMGKLESKMILLGYADYSKACDEIAKMIDEGEKRE